MLDSQRFGEDIAHVVYHFRREGVQSALLGWFPIEKDSIVPAEEIPRDRSVSFGEGLRELAEILIR